MQNHKTDIVIYLVRHGQTVGNLDTGAMGQTPEDQLSDLGLRQAQMVARWFKQKQIPLDAIYSSNYSRAIDTAELIAKENNFSSDQVVGADSLVELSVGDWAENRIEEVMTPEVDLTLNSKGIDFVWPGGESFRMVERRVSSWLEKEILHNPKYLEGKKHIVIVTHGNAIRALLYYILGCNDRLIHRFQIDNCGLNIFNYKKYGWHTLTINSTEHLHVGNQ
jgi:broad specificity phosphatase PhoE